MVQEVGAQGRREGSKPKGVIVRLFTILRVSSQRRLADKARQTTSCSRAVRFCPGDSFLLHSGTRRSAFRRGWNFYFIITAVRTHELRGEASYQERERERPLPPPPPPSALLLRLLCAPLARCRCIDKYPLQTGFDSTGRTRVVRAVPSGVKPRAHRGGRRPSRPDACADFNLFDPLFSGRP